MHMIGSLNFVCRHYAVLSHPAYKLNIFQVMGIKASAEEGLYSLLKANEGIAVQLHSHYFIVRPLLFGFYLVGW